jgi:hypothetical protein
MGFAPVMPHCSLLRNHGPKQTGVLEHYREVETNLLFFIFRVVAFRPLQLSDESTNVHFFIKQFYLQELTHNEECPSSKKPVNCTNEFRELFEATTC